VSCKEYSILDTPLGLQQNSSYALAEEKQVQNERASRSQPRIARHGIGNRLEKN